MATSEERRSQGPTIVLGVALTATFAYALALHTENERLREQIAHGAQTGLSAGAATAPAGIEPPSAPAAAPTPVAAAAPGRELTAAQRASFIERLRGSAGKAWVATTPTDPEAAAYRASLVSAMKEAGWQILSDETLTFRTKPGVFLFLAGDEAPPYLGSLNDALSALGEKVTLGRQYRSFYEEMKQKNPRYVGFDFKKDQEYLLVVGPRPKPSETSEMSPAAGAL